MDIFKSEMAKKFRERTRDMKIHAALRKLISSIAAMGLVSILGVGCSGSQQEEEKLEASPADEKAEEPKAEEEPAAEEGDTEASVAPEPVPVAEVPSPAPASNSAADKNRVVRYINSDVVTIHGQPSDSAEPVGKLMKGDMILVVEDGGWGKISDNMFVKTNVLTKKAVPRNRNPAVWGKPTH
jgi:hypothetical protein